MNRANILLGILAVVLIGFLLANLQPDRTSLRSKKRRPTASKEGSGKPRPAASKKKPSKSGDAQGAGQASKSKATNRDTEGENRTPSTSPLYQLPYALNVGYPVLQPEPESTATRFDIPQNSRITAAKAGIIVGVSGPTPKPGEDFVFGRRMPSSAILIQHQDSSFALYQNVQASGVDSGEVVVKGMRIGTKGLGVFKLSISHPTRKTYTWKFSTRHAPKGTELINGRVYLRSDSEVDHPVNAIKQTYTAAAGDYRKSSFRRGETVQLHTRFRFPVRAKIQYAFRKPSSDRTFKRNALLSTDRLSCHFNLSPRVTKDVKGTDWRVYLTFDDQVMDSTNFSIQDDRP